MVIDDLFSKQDASRGETKQVVPSSRNLFQIAAPIDRLAAFVGEIPIFVPLVSVFLAPFRHDMAVAQLASSQLEMFYSIGGMIGVVLGCWLTYQTLSIYFFGATPGKYFVGLRVVSIEDGQKPSLTMSFLRAISLCIEFLLCGFPWLASLSHPDRRVLHDRMSDTYVQVLDPHKASGAPLLIELQLARNMRAPGWALLSVLMAFVITHFNSEKREVAIVADLEKTEQLCPAVSEAMKLWVSDLNEHPSRIAAALALYESEKIDENCLEKEAHFSLWRGLDKDMGYLAQALAHSDDEKASEHYLARVCETRADGDACRLAQELKISNEETIRKPASTDSMNTDFMRLHAIRFLHDQHQPEKALQLVEESSNSQNFYEFLTLERLKILWETDRNLEARAVFQASRAHLDQVSKIQISSWMCSAEIVSGCGNDAKKICRQFANDFDKISSGLESEPVELSYIRAQKCIDPLEMDYVNIDKKLTSERARQYLEALELVADRKMSEAKKILKPMSEQTSSDEFQAQALADLVSLTNSKSELEGFYEEFLIKKNHLSEPQFAFSLMNRYLKLGEASKSRQVAKELLEYFPLKASLSLKKRKISDVQL
jgi:uncharacterized RDD family membrane protein YckC